MEGWVWDFAWQLEGVYFASGLCSHLIGTPMGISLKAVTSDFLGPLLFICQETAMSFEILIKCPMFACTLCEQSTRASKNHGDLFNMQRKMMLLWVLPLLCKYFLHSNALFGLTLENRLSNCKERLPGCGESTNIKKD